MANPSNCWWVVAEQCNPFLSEIATHQFHHKPQEKETCHFKIRVRNYFWCLRLLNVLGPFPPVDSWYASFIFPNYNASDTMWGSITDFNIVRPTSHQFAALSRRIWGFPEQRPAGYNHRQYHLVLLEIYHWCFFLDYLVAWCEQTLPRRYCCKCMANLSHYGFKLLEIE